MRKQQNLQVKSLEYLKDTMTLYGTYSADKVEDIVDNIKHLHRNLTRFEKIPGGSQTC